MLIIDSHCSYEIYALPFFHRQMLSSSGVENTFELFHKLVLLEQTAL